MKPINTTIGNLLFGTNVFQGDSILPYATSDGLVRINSESDLENIKNHLNNDLEVIIDREKPWHSVFEITAFTQTRLEWEKKKAEYIRESYCRRRNTSFS